MEAAELALSDLAPTDADVPFAPHNLALSGGGLQFRRRVNTHALSNSPAVRPS
jgi:hypothetical protein